MRLEEIKCSALLCTQGGKCIFILFLILKGCTSSSVVRMRHVEIKSGDIGCRIEDFLPRVGKNRDKLLKEMDKVLLEFQEKIGFSVSSLPAYHQS